MKKIYLSKIERKARNIILKIAAAVILSGLAMPCATEAMAAEATKENSTTTYVYHQHIGNDSEKGGCYQAPVYHSHSGNEKDGGSCFKTPVYHVHVGDEEKGGPCYGTPVLHVHTGNPQEGGGCFTAVYHRHAGDCYKTVSYEEDSCSIVNWWDTADGDDDTHDFKYYEMSCGRTIYGTNPSHTHKILKCTKGETIEKYILGCGKTEEDVENYLFDCEKLEGISIDSYLLSCEKTSETIDGYSISCGKDEDTPCGKITVTEYKGKNKRKTSVTATFEDLTGGEIKLSEDPFTWYDQKGNLIGSGETITVSKNGSYIVRLGVTNEDVNKDSLKAEIKISSIVKPSGGGDDNDDDDDDDDNDGGDDDDDSDEDTDDGESGGKPTASPSVSPSSTPNVSPTPTPAAVKKDNKKKPDPTPVSTPTATNLKNEVKREKDSIPSASPEWKKRTESVKISENNSGKEELEEIKMMENNQKGLSGLLSSPTVRLFSITAGTLLAILGSFLLIYLFRMSVRVYNDDGNGNMIYLGRCRVMTKEEGYVIEITHAMAEKAITNRYCIKPGLFRLFKSEEEEITICRYKNKVSVPLSKEMIVIV